MSAWHTFETRAQELDANNELSSFRGEFNIPDKAIYFDGNSLGLLSKPSVTEVLQVLDDWRSKGIDGWLNAKSPWFYMAEEIGSMMATLVGAGSDEVIAANSTTVNLHQLLATLYQPVGGRSKILVDGHAFPTDRYAINGHLRLRGLDPASHIQFIEAGTDRIILESDIVKALSENVAMAVLPAVVYTTGQLLDIAKISMGARARGILIGWDCSHSIGAVPHFLDKWDVDFAFWCSYKYLNGGPGATGGLYLNRRHFGKKPGLAGWFASKKSAQFDMCPELEQAENAGAMQIGSPNILSMAPLLGSLKQIQSAGIDRLRSKSLQMTDFIIELAERWLSDFGFNVVTPRDRSMRGGHVALAHAEAARICKALKDQKVIPDHRPPDIIRLAPVPLYNTFGECVAAIRAIEHIMGNKLYENYASGREIVA